MKQWLDQNGEDFILHGGIGQPQTLQTLNTESQQKQKKLQEEVVSSEQSEDDDEVYEIPQTVIDKQNQKPGRSSVSAEAFGQFNKQSEFKARVIAKSSAQKDRIIKRMNQAFMFAALEEKDRDIVINAMEEKKFKPGDLVINQGDDGAELYIVDTGQLECSKVFKKGEDAQVLRQYVSGESFGELSLLYNAPRAATIVAQTDSVLFALDRDTFNHIVKESAVKKRQKYDTVLASVDLLQDMEPYERANIADALIVVKSQQGEYVITQDEEGDRFFMIQEGELVAMKQFNQDEPAQQVLSYTPGKYFGELALLNNKPRQASVICQTDCTLLSLDRSSFKRLLGPVDEILKRNSDNYAQFANQ